MNYTVGIDLGSTTTKAVILDESSEIMGRGITNSRSNYDVACNIALSEALINARFALIASELEAAGVEAEAAGKQISRFQDRFRHQQYLSQLRSLSEHLGVQVERWSPDETTREVNSILVPAGIAPQAANATSRTNPGA